MLVLELIELEDPKLDVTRDIPLLHVQVEIIHSLPEPDLCCVQVCEQGHNLCDTWRGAIEPFILTVLARHSDMLTSVRPRTIRIDCCTEYLTKKGNKAFNVGVGCDISVSDRCHGSKSEVQAYQVPVVITGDLLRRELAFSAGTRTALPRSHSHFLVAALSGETAVHVLNCPIELMLLQFLHQVPYASYPVCHHGQRGKESEYCPGRIADLGPEA
eukprot:scaffold1318_cov388-Prasinococcus_capsulatus_cf.AAC.91